MTKAFKPTDEQIIAAIGQYAGTGVMTYVVCNILTSVWRKGRPDTSFVRRRLMAMEKAGKVKRMPTSYATQLCWGLA